MKFKLMTLGLLAFSAVASADFEGIEYVRAYDADTITINIPNVSPIFGNKIGVRLLGIDTPELRTKDKCEKSLGLKARDYVRVMFLSSPKITLKQVSRGKYFRIVADMLLDGKSISKDLIANGYAVEYWGGTKQPVDWCKMSKAKEGAK